jgi:hypothetical protein
MLKRIYVLSPAVILVQPSAWQCAHFTAPHADLSTTEWGMVKNRFPA